MSVDPKVTPCLWFDNEGEEVAEFYTSVFPNSSIDYVNRSTIEWPGGKVGDALLIEFSLAGQPYQALNGGPQEPFNDRISLSVSCKDQEEVDYFWDALTSDGGEPVMCGWLKDKFGVRWQIVPEPLERMLRDQDSEKVRRAMEAMLQMVKLDLAELEQAFEGT
ncbi:VOC family protein [Stratiformator vulcanicus]|uniref:3-demethylubiquinone-9 3-methyltransferase n=1 Tax=Stratiformator vulcanicus TaxID=2527980 RepID=A0A517R020_9PLAN|nr:VOC family protein [Stratiformator vulcanicus]QDT37247.1 3-demethylubiquinone-9 3-methyltransferase [Stratiformator vulcanicus]